MGYFLTLCAVLATSFGVVLYKQYAIKKRLLLLVTAIISFILAPVFSFLALKYLSVDTVYMMTSLNGLIVLILSYYVLKEKVVRMQILGAFLVFCGVSIYMV
ncbi:EamA family transporter [Colwellia sp. BRX10-3]|uniref:EamA family transporter n=1 Tax=Colwellia sp. BRX10-3 TaxID=2759844 RepID=UPI001C70F3D6|nr:EamA family transporter [Colwellia sp. BRX10-3]